MYQVRRDDKGQHVLYHVDRGSWDVVAFFPDKDDAEFAREAFEEKYGSLPKTDDNPLRCLTTAP